MPWADRRNKSRPQWDRKAGFTAATLVRLKRLKPSAIRSSFRRSPKGICLDRRRSTSKKPGPTKALRPRLPSQPKGGVKGGTENVEPLLVRQILAGAKCTPGIKGEVVPPLETTDGRAWEAPRSKRVSVPVRTLNGRPEETSMIGASVKFPMKCFHGLSPTLPDVVWKTPLVTQRWRWSLTEFDFSKFAKRLSWGSSVDCKSVPLSMECDHV